MRAQTQWIALAVLAAGCSRPNPDFVHGDGGDGGPVQGGESGFGEGTGGQDEADGTGAESSTTAGSGESDSSTSGPGVLTTGAEGSSGSTGGDASSPPCDVDGPVLCYDFDDAVGSVVEDRIADRDVEFDNAPFAAGRWGDALDCTLGCEGFTGGLPLPGPFTVEIWFRFTTDQLPPGRARLFEIEGLNGELDFAQQPGFDGEPALWFQYDDYVEVEPYDDGTLPWTCAAMRFDAVHGPEHVLVKEGGGKSVGAFATSSKPDFSQTVLMFADTISPAVLIDGVRVWDEYRDDACDEPAL